MNKLITAYGAWGIRLMKMSEHTDQSWNDIFGVLDEDRRNYCVFNISSGRVIDDCLTLKEAKDIAEEYSWKDHELEVEYEG